MKATDWVVLLLIVLNAMVLAALGARVPGFELPPAAIFGLMVLGAPVPVVLAVLPSFGVRVPALAPPRVTPDVFAGDEDRDDDRTEAAPLRAPAR